MDARDRSRPFDGGHAVTSNGSRESDPVVRVGRPTPGDAAVPRFDGPVEARLFRPPSVAGRPGATDLPPHVEVQRDHPHRTELPPLNVLPGDVRIEADAGRRKVRVMTTGVFDLIHIGHVRMLEAAKKLGDELIVVIARDETVRRMKHDPINPEDVRRQIVASLRSVDRAVLGNVGDIYRIVAELRPEVVALGYDQAFQEDEVRRRCAGHGVDVRVVRLPEFAHDLDATRKLIDRIADRIERKELYTSREG